MEDHEVEAILELVDTIDLDILLDQPTKIDTLKKLIYLIRNVDFKDILSNYDKIEKYESSFNSINNSGYELSEIYGTLYEYTESIKVYQELCESMNIKSDISLDSFKSSLDELNDIIYYINKESDI